MIRRVTLPVSTSPGHVNVYLIPSDGGYTLVDCGMCWSETRAAFTEAGVDFASIRRIVLTHAHPDHCGLASRIRDLSGAPILMHESEQREIDAIRDADAWLMSDARALSAAGVPEGLRESIAISARGMRRMMPLFRADATLRDGDTLDTDLGPMRAIHTPGHAPGHLCFHLAGQGVLLSGDQLLIPAAPHLAWEAGGGTLLRYLESLDRLDATRATTVLPAHGAEFTDLRARTAAVRSASAVRRDHVRLLSRVHFTAHSVASAFWERTLTPFQHRAAVYEMLAYLEAVN